MQTIVAIPPLDIQKPAVAPPAAAVVKNPPVEAVVLVEFCGTNVVKGSSVADDELVEVNIVEFIAFAIVLAVVEIAREVISTGMVAVDI
jgi:hypothetical protein